MSEANKVMISVTGMKYMNLPTIPGQKASGTKGASVVSVPDKIGTKTSPAAILAALTMLSFPIPCLNILCVFSITTMASSTTMPSAKMKENITSMFIVNPMRGKTI